MNMTVSPGQEEEVQGENWHMCKRKLWSDMKKLKWGWVGRDGRGKAISAWERIWRGTATVQNTVARATGSPGSVNSWVKYPTTGTERDSKETSPKYKSKSVTGIPTILVITNELSN